MLECLCLRNCLLYCIEYTGTCIIIYYECSYNRYSVQEGYVHIVKLSLRAAVGTNRSITASMLGGVRSVDLYKHHKTLKTFLLHSSCECSLMCNVNVVNGITCFCLIVFFLERIGGGFGHTGSGHPPATFLPK